MDLAEAPHGKVRVRLRSQAEGRPGGRVEVLHPSPQAATVLPGMTDEAVAKVVYEVADLWFHTMVLLSHFNLTPDDVVNELARREGLSGLEEKALRKSQARDAAGE